jgi:uncharacterized membrane protein YhaH (DUF805 family)
VSVVLCSERRGFGSLRSLFVVAILGRCTVTEFTVVRSLAVTVCAWSVRRRRHHRLVKTGEPIVLAIFTLVISCGPSADAVGSLSR